MKLPKPPAGRKWLPKLPAGRKWSWTQPICDPCWVIYGDPTREPFRISPLLREKERCAWCGNDTGSGIYSRVDPAEVNYPRVEDV